MFKSTLLASGLFVGLFMALPSQAIYQWRDASGLMNYGETCPAGMKCKIVGGGTRKKISSTAGTGTDPATEPTTTTTPTGVIWSADNETGDLSQYSSGGGGMVIRNINWQTDTTGTVIVEPTKERARSGQWSVKLGIPSGRSIGPEGIQAQVIRWEESKTNPELYYSTWLYLPQYYNVAPVRGGWMNLIQFHSVGGGTRAVVAGLELARQTSTSANTLNLVGEFIGATKLSSAPLPVGRWFNIEVRVRRDAGTQGLIQVWLDGVELFSLQNVRTARPENTHHEYYVNVYGWNITPSPAYIYADDLAISKYRIWQ